MAQKYNPALYRNMLLKKIEQLKQQISKMDNQERQKCTHIAYQLGVYEQELERFDIGE